MLSRQIPVRRCKQWEFLKTIDKLELSDDVKEKLRQEHASEFDPLKSERDSLKAKDRRSSVEDEVKSLSDPGLLRGSRPAQVLPPRAAVG